MAETSNESAELILPANPGTPEASDAVECPIMAEAYDSSGMIILPSPNLNTNPEVDVHNSKEAKAHQRTYDFRQHRKLTDVKQSSLREDWDKHYRRNKRYWEKLQQICNRPLDELSHNCIRTLVNEMDELYKQWKNSESHLVNIQQQLEDPELVGDMQRLEMLSAERGKIFQGCKDSFHKALQSKSTSREKASSSQCSHASATHSSKKAASEKAESKATHRSHASSQRSQVVPPYKSSQSRPGSSVSRQSSASDSYHPSKASSRHSQSSRASTARSFAARAAEARVEVAAAKATLSMAKEEQLLKEKIARVQARQQEEMARLDYLKYEREILGKVALAEALEAEAERASLNFNPGQLEEKDSNERVKAYVEDQNSPQQGQGGEPHPPAPRTTQAADIVRSRPRDSSFGSARPTPAIEDIRGNQSTPSAAVKESQEPSTQTTTRHHLRVEAAEFQPNLPGIPSADVQPNGGNPLACQVKDLSSPVAWEDEIVRKYSIGNYQQALALNPALANTVGRTLPPPPSYNSPVVQKDTATSWRRMDLAHRGVHKFSDKSGIDYMLWKLLFVNAIKGERLEPAEELGHMITWLGPRSIQAIKEVYASKMYEPVEALRLSWETLDERYGAPTMTESSFLEQVDNFPAMDLSNPQELWHFSGLLTQLRSAQMDPTLPGLSCLDLYKTQRSIVKKLPTKLVDAWIDLADNYRTKNLGREPPFAALQEFVAHMSKKYNDPRNKDLIIQRTSASRRINQSLGPIKSPAQDTRGKAFVSVHSTEVVPVATRNSDVRLSKSALHQSQKAKEQPVCPLHKTSHTLNKCREFRKKSLGERKALIKEYKVCFKCCESTDHMAKTCTVKVLCYLCKSDQHPTALHLDRESTPRPIPAPRSAPTLRRTPNPTPIKEPQHDNKADPDTATRVNCTSVCKDSPLPRSCHPICLVKVYPAGHPEEAVKMYVVVDAQSNQSLAKSAFFDRFDIQSEEIHFTMSTCMGVQRTAGRKATGFCIESLDGSAKFALPPLLECDALPDDRSQIATPEVASNIPHLRHLANLFPALDPEAEILLLLGVDAPEAFPPQEVVKGPAGSPHAFKTELGWAILGTVCVDRLQAPNQANVFMTSILSNGRMSHLKPCQEHFTISTNNPDLGATVFQTSKEDNDLALSIEDKEFLQLMGKEFQKDVSGRWVAPLPFRTPRQRLQRRKWKTKEPNLEEGDLVLLKDKDAHRNAWPMGLVHQVLPSSDGLVRQVEVLIVKPEQLPTGQLKSTRKVYARPITDLVLLRRKSELIVLEDLQDWTSSFA